MKKLIIILILLIAVTSDVYAFNWDKFERKAYTVLEFTYVGVVGMGNMGSGLHFQLYYFPEF